MGRLSKNDKRYLMLAKMPKIKNECVVFRKRPKHRNKFMLATVDVFGKVTTAFIKYHEAVDELGEKFLNVDIDA